MAGESSGRNPTISLTQELEIEARVALDQIAQLVSAATRSLHALCHRSEVLSALRKKETVNLSSPLLLAVCCFNQPCALTRQLENEARIVLDHLAQLASAARWSWHAMRHISELLFALGKEEAGDLASPLLRAVRHLAQIRPRPEEYWFKF